MATHRNPSSRDIELLSAYIDNELSEVERAALEARLDREPHLQQELEALTVVVEAVRALPPLQAPRDFTLTPEMIAREEQAQKTAATVLIFPTSAAFSALSAAAATLLVVFGAMLLFMQASPLPGASFAPAADDAIVAVQPTATPVSLFQATVLPALTVTVPPPTQTPQSTPSPAPTSLPAQPQADALEGAIEEEAMEMELEVAEEAAGASIADRADTTRQAAQTMQSVVEDGTATSNAFIVATDTQQQRTTGADDTDGLTFVTGTPATGQTIVVVPPTATMPPLATPAPLLTSLPGGVISQRQSPTSTTAPPPDTPQRPSRIDPAQVIGLSSLVAGIALMGVAAVTTIARRRRRRLGRS